MAGLVPLRTRVAKEVVLALFFPRSDPGAVDPSPQLLVACPHVPWGRGTHRLLRVVSKFPRQHRAKGRLVTYRRNASRSARLPT